MAVRRDVLEQSQGKDFDGSNLEEFLPWYAMLRADVTTNWPMWGSILDKWEVQGERGVNDDDIEAAMESHSKTGGRSRPACEVANAFFRIFAGEVPGEVQIAILKSGCIQRISTINREREVTYLSSVARNKGEFAYHQESHPCRRL